MRMTKIVKFRELWTLLALISFNCLAENSAWNNREVNLVCGEALVQIIAKCRPNPKDATNNICKNYTMKIINYGNKRTYVLPYISESQRASLLSQGYRFNNIIKPGDWAPQTLSCYDNKSLLIGYTTGMNDEEEIENSLTSNTQSPFFYLNGNFITGLEEKVLRQRELRRNGGYVNINFTVN